MAVKARRALKESGEEAFGAGQLDGGAHGLAKDIGWKG